MVKADVEPLVDLVMKLKVLVADLLRRKTFFERLGLRRRPVLIRPANVQRVVTP